METVVEVEVNAESKSEVSKTSSTEKSLKLIADPVVYQLVRVEGDGRLVPATDEEVFEVEDLLDDRKSTRILPDTGRDVECASDSKISSGILQSENLEPCSDKSGEVLDFKNNSMKSNTQIQEIVPSLAPNTIHSHLSESGECSNPQVGVTGSESLNSSSCYISKPDFSKLKGEICLNNLSVRELHEIFRAIFGRVTTNKDKQWLKRRISMALTNSCDVSTTTFVIEDHKVVKKGKEENNRIPKVNFKDPIKGAMDKICKGSSSVAKKEVESHLNCSGKRMRNANVVYDHDKEEVLTESKADKRVRKPTKRYIEEVSEEESREAGGKVTSKVTGSGHCHSSPRPSVQPIQNIRSDGRPFVMRQDSLGGSGIQIPYVSRVRRCRPRENYMTFMKLQPSEVGTPSKVVKKASEMCDSRPDSEEGNNIVKAGSSPEWVQQPLISKPEKAEENSERITEFAKDDLQLQRTDPSNYYSDDGIASVPTATGGMRRKHHRIWTLNEVVKLVEGVARYGVGRWSEIKRVFFASHSHRTSVDLKDKWRNLLRASFAQLPSDKGVDNSRKHASIPIPAPILARVRELAEIEGHFPPNISRVKFAGHSVRDVHERRSGYL